MKLNCVCRIQVGVDDDEEGGVKDKTRVVMMRTSWKQSGLWSSSGK